MPDRKDSMNVIVDAIHEARAVLAHHVQTKQGGQPEETIEDLRATLENVDVTEALRKLSGETASYKE